MLEKTSQVQRTAGYTLCVIGGLLLGATQLLHFPWVGMIGMAALCGAVLMWPSCSRAAGFRVGLLAIFWLSLGIWRGQMTTDVAGATVKQFIDLPATIVGTVVSVDRRATTQQLTLDQVVVQGQPATGRILVTADAWSDFRYGSVLQFSCALTAPQPFNDFAYDRYLALQRIFALCRRPQAVQQIAYRPLQPWRAALLGLQQTLLTNLQQALPEPASALAGGILLGAKQSLPEALRTDFQRTGLAHLVALSGYNITIVSGVLLQLALRAGLHRRWAVLVAGAGIAAFVMMTGAQASAVRAALMGGLVLLVQQSGRIMPALLLLLYAAAAMLWWQPLLLVSDVGFQLSFAATAGLLFGAAPLEKRLRHIPQRFGIRQSTATTLAALIFVTPLLTYHFAAASLLALPANVLVAPAMPLAMGSSTVTALAAGIHPALGRWVGVAAWLALEYVRSIAAGLSALPWAAITLPRFGLAFWLVQAVSGSAIVMVLYWRWRDDRMRRKLLLRT